MGTYEDVFRLSTEDPESFWLKAAEGIDWDVAPQRALDSSGAPFYRWFPDGRLNVAFNALDRHIEAGRGEQPALVYDSPVTGTRRTPADRRIRDLRSLTVPPGPVFQAVIIGSINAYCSSAKSLGYGSRSMPASLHAHAQQMACPTISS